MELQSEKRFQNLTVEQIQALDRVLTEVIPIYGRGNFPTLQVRAKDMIRVVKERLLDRHIRVKDVRLNGATASHVLVRDNGLGHKHLDIIFGVDLPRQEDFQVIKEVVLGSLRDLLPCGVNRRKITCLTMKEAYVQKMVKVFNEHDRWSLICLSNNRAKTVGLRFVSSLRRHFEFSVDSFQIILDRMLESYWEGERRQSGQMTPSVKHVAKGEDGNEEEKRTLPKVEDGGKIDLSRDCNTCKEQSKSESENVEIDCEKEEVLQSNKADLDLKSQADMADIGKENIVEDIVFEFCKETVENDCQFHKDDPLSSSQKPLIAEEPQMTHPCQKDNKESIVSFQQAEQVKTVGKELEDVSQMKADPETTNTTSALASSHLEYTFPPPAKKSCSTSLDIAPPDTCPSPKLQRKMSRKQLTKPTPPEKWSLLTDLSDLTTELFPPIEIPKPLQRRPSLMNQNSSPETSEGPGKTISDSSVDKGVDVRDGSEDELSVKPKHSKKPPDLETCEVDSHALTDTQIVGSSENILDTLGSLEDTMDSLGSLKNTMDTLGDLEDKMDTLGSLKNTMDTLGSLENSMDTLGSLKNTMDTLGPSENILDTLGSLKNTMDTLGSLENTMDTLESLKNPMNTLGPSENILDTLGSSKNPTDTLGPPDSSLGPTITVEAECMFGDFHQAMHHLHNRLIATHNPEEIRGGGLLKYSDLLVRNFRPASETEIKSLERYMCSRFFIDFPDVGEQQRKIEAYLQCHYIGSEEASKYDYLMTLRRVIDESTVCLMGHERRQTLNMITVLALRVLGEQNAIPNTANVTCFYQPAPYVSEPVYSSYFIGQTQQPALVYHPYPLHVHLQTGMV